MSGIKTSPQLLTAEQLSGLRWLKEGVTAPTSSTAATASAKERTAPLPPRQLTDEEQARVKFPLPNCLNGCTGCTTVHTYRKQAVACRPVGTDGLAQARKAFSEGHEPSLLPCRQAQHSSERVKIKLPNEHGGAEKIFYASSLKDER